MQVKKQLLIRGVDMSFLPQIRQSGLVFYNLQGQQEDMLLSLKKAGVNTIRLRLWHSPSPNNATFEQVRKLAQEVQKMSMKVLLSVHYSDTWADPAQQKKPAAWENLPLPILKDSLSAYTKKICEQIRPDYIQIGNEINHGFLWQEGSWQNISVFRDLLKVAVAAARQSSPQSKIILHYAGHQQADYFYSRLPDIDYDIIGLSYYPFWHGKDLEILSRNIKNLSQKYTKDVFIAETSYPFTFSWNDWTNNVIGEPGQILDDFAATPLGQKAYLEKISLLSSQAGALGFCYWGGEWVSFRGSQVQDGSTWENQALWDFRGNALPAQAVFGQEF